MAHNPISNLLPTGAVVLTSLTAFAPLPQNPAPLVVGVYPTKQEGKIYLAVEKQASTFACVQLLDQAGEELYQAALPRKGTTFSQVFDLHELKDGMCTVRVRQGNTVIVKPIQARTTVPEPTGPVRYVTLGE